MPILQLSFFTASAAYKTDTILSEDVLNALRGQDGVQHVFNGLQNESEGAELAVVVLVWDTYEHSQRAQGAFAKIVAGAIDGSAAINSHFIDTPKDPLPCLRAPTTEFVVVSCEESNRETLMGLVAQQNASLDKASRAYPPCHCLPTVTDPNVILFFVGWDSREVHFETVSVAPFTTFIPGMIALSQTQMIHANMISYDVGTGRT